MLKQFPFLHTSVAGFTIQNDGNCAKVPAGILLSSQEQNLSGNWEICEGSMSYHIKRRSSTGENENFNTADKTTGKCRTI